MAVTVPLFGGSFNPVQLAAVQAWANALDQAAQDDPQAALLARHKGIIIALVKRYAEKGAQRGLTVDDLLQLGAVEILVAMPEYDAAKGKESTFLVPRLYDKFQKATGERLKTAQPYFLDITAPLSTDNDLTLADVLPADVDVEDEAIGRTDRDRQRAALRAMWQTLSDYDRMLLTLFYFEHRNVQDIADMLGVAKQTISLHLQNIVGRMRAAHELAQSLRKSDSLNNRLADPADKNARARARRREARQAKASQPTVLEPMEQITV